MRLFLVLLLLAGALVGYGHSQEVGRASGSGGQVEVQWEQAKADLLKAHAEAIGTILEQLDSQDRESREANDIPAVKLIQKKRSDYLSSFVNPDGVESKKYEAIVSAAQQTLKQARDQAVSFALNAKQDEFAERVDREFKLLSNPVVPNVRTAWQSAVEGFEQEIDRAIQELSAELGKAEDSARAKGDLEAVQRLKSEVAELAGNRQKLLSDAASPIAVNVAKAKKKLSDVNKNLVKALLLAKEDEEATGMQKSLNQLIAASSPRPSTANTKETGEVVENSLGMVLVRIPKGTFWMGGGGGERDELPAHSVTISKDFYIGKFEVTQKQYKAVMGRNPSFFRGDKRPVESVDWNDAVEFCEQLSKLPEERAAGRNYRLPTEAEWELACRGGTTTTYYFGDDARQAEDHAWFVVNANKQTHDVGLKKPNPFGLYDMNGNVWEWCSDWHASRYPTGPLTDPTGPEGGKNRTTRGAGYINSVDGVRAQDRGTYPPDTKNAWQGFRVVMVVD
jgi:formylglycine-generating enzyme required for sulfatase activity